MSPIVIVIIIIAIVIILIVIVFTKGEEGLGRIINRILPKVNTTKADGHSHQSPQRANSDYKFQGILNRIAKLETESKQLKNEIGEMKKYLATRTTKSELSNSNSLSTNTTSSSLNQRTVAPQPVYPREVLKTQDTVSARDQKQYQSTNSNLIYCGLPNRGVFPEVSVDECFYILEKQTSNTALYSINSDRSIAILNSYDLIAASECQITSGNVNSGTQIKTHHKGKAELTASGWRATTRTLIIIE